MKKNIVEDINVYKVILIKNIKNILKKQANKKIECHLKIIFPDDYIYANLDLTNF